MAGSCLLDVSLQLLLDGHRSALRKGTRPEEASATQSMKRDMHVVHSFVCTRAYAEGGQGDVCQDLACECRDGRTG